MKRLLSLISASFVICLLIFMFIRPSAAYLDGDVVASNLCNPMYTNIKKIYLAQQQNIPGEDASNKHYLEETKKFFEKTLNSENISIEITDKKPEQIFAEGEGNLYVEVFYSYIKKDAFTVQTPDDFLAVWFKISKKLNAPEKALYNTEIVEIAPHLTPPVSPQGTIEYKTDVDFFEYLPDGFDSKIIISSAPYRHMTDVVCDVMHFTANKNCTDRNKFSENNLVSLKKSCEMTK